MVIKLTVEEAKAVKSIVDAAKGVLRSLDEHGPVQNGDTTHCNLRSAMVNHKHTVDNALEVLKYNE